MFSRSRAVRASICSTTRSRSLQRWIKTALFFVSLSTLCTKSLIFFLEMLYDLVWPFCKKYTHKVSLTLIYRRSQQCCCSSSVAVYSFPPWEPLIDYAVFGVFLHLAIQSKLVRRQSYWLRCQVWWMPTWLTGRLWHKKTTRNSQFPIKKIHT